MSNFFEKWANESNEHQKLVAQERLIVETTEMIHAKMEALGVNRVQLAERMGKSKAYVSQLLSGSRNMTLRSLADICFALELGAPVFSFKPSQGALSQSDDWEYSGNIVKMSEYRAKAQAVDISEVELEDGWMRAAQ